MPSILPPKTENEVPAPSVESIGRGLISIIPNSRNSISDKPSDKPSDNPETAEAANPISSMLETRGALKKAYGDFMEVDRIEEVMKRHLQEFPHEPNDGFEKSEDYLKYTLQMNEFLALEKELFDKAPLILHFEDKEKPGFKRKQFLMECADGRNSVALFLPPNRLLSRFDMTWKPNAGVIVFPEISDIKDSESLEKELTGNPDLKKKLFDRLDFIYAQELKNHLAHADEKKISRIHFEYQSHVDLTHFPDHGCGAHGCNFDKAQLETLKNCVITEMWLKEKYPKESEKDMFRVYRTVHDNSENGNIYGGKAMDEKYVKDEFKKERSGLFADASRFEAPVPDNEKDSVVRYFKNNSLNIETAEHYEQTIRISDRHLAHTLVGQSVLEISWTDNVDTLFGHLNVLIGIAQNNFQKKNPKKPIIVHLDIPKDSSEHKLVYTQLMAKITDSQKIAELISGGKLQFVTTETDRVSYKTAVAS